MQRKLNLSAFIGEDDDEEDDLILAPKVKPTVELTDLKSKRFAHGNTKKTKKDLEREAEEKRRLEEEKAQALVMAEYEQAFEKPEMGYAAGRGGPMSRGGFVRAGGAPFAPPTGPGNFGFNPPPRPAGYNPPAGPSGFGGFAPPSGPGGWNPPQGPSGFNAPSGPSSSSASGFRPPAPMGYGAGRMRAFPKEPSPPPTTAASKPKGKRAMDAFLQEIKGNQEMREQRLGKMAKMEGSSVTALAAWETAPGGRPTNMDSESSNLFIYVTTNQESPYCAEIFKANLPHNISEESLGLFFAKHGPVGTVKVMWPRGAEFAAAASGENRRGQAGLTGFVNYMTRRDAEKAVAELDGLNWGGNVIRVGFSKFVATPQKALYDLSGKSDRKRSRSRSRSRSPQRGSRRDRAISPARQPPRPHSRSPLPRRQRQREHSHSRSRSRSRSPLPVSKSDSQSRPRRGRSRSRSYSSSSRSASRSYSRSRSRSPPPKKKTLDVKREKWLAKVPAEQAKFIKTVAGKVLDHGKGFEDMLKEKERGNPKFQFFFNVEAPEHHLYKLSLDSRFRIPTPPPDQFEDEGYASCYSSDSAEDSEKERIVKGNVGKLARRRFESLLRAMSGKRFEIARAMEFAMKRAEAADEIADVICQSLRLDSTPVPRKVARLHLVSDILHNSASPLPNVWKYRLAFEQRLAPVFAHLHSVYQSLDAYSGKLSSGVFQTQIMAILEIWERWIVFTQDVNDNFRGLFMGTNRTEEQTDPAEHQRSQEHNGKPSKSAGDGVGEMSKFKSGGFKSSFKPAVAPTAITETEDDLDDAPIADNDLDGDPIDSDLDGEAIDNHEEELDGEPLAAEENLDGEPLALGATEHAEEDTDGEPMEMDDDEDEDLDGAPI